MRYNVYVKCGIDIKQIAESGSSIPLLKSLRNVNFVEAGCDGVKDKINIYPDKYYLVIEDFNALQASILSAPLSDATLIMQFPGFKYAIEGSKMFEENKITNFKKINYIHAFLSFFADQPSYRGFLSILESLPYVNQIYPGVLMVKRGMLLVIWNTKNNSYTSFGLSEYNKFSDKLGEVIKIRAHRR